MAIEHISDTARWVAIYRAMESERPDAIFHDPFARRLAGAKGEEIVATLKRGRSMAWPMIVRTAVFDELILKEVRAGADLVLNLAAGLDARPWRLDLPPTLQWIDVDLPGILGHKVEELKRERPKCRYEPIMLDLRDVAKRRSLFELISTRARRVLVCTEGLLIYLEPAEVVELAKDLHAQKNFDSWIIDLASPTLLKFMSRSWGKAVAQGNAPFKFAPEENTKFFEPTGWVEREYRSMGEEAERLHRTMNFSWLFKLFMLFSSRQRRERWKRFSGIVLLGRA